MSLKKTELGNLPIEWEVEMIENVLEEIIDYRGKTPKKANEGIETLSARSVKNGYIDYSNAYYISPETYKEFMVRGFPKKEDILLTTEAPLGNVAKLNKDNVAIAQRLLTLRGKENYMANEYLMYYLMSAIGQHQLHSRATGTTVTGIKQSEFKKILITVPTFHEQKSIANILSSLDEKIEINNQIIRKLEEMAQAIYKQWFVDFEFLNEDGEPYKSSGGEMIESELGLIPKGWEVGTVNDIGTIVGGGTPSKKREDYFTDNGIPWITPKDLSGNKNKFISRGALDITEDALKNSSAKLMSKGTVLFSSRAPIGYIAIARNPVTTNQGFKSVIPNEDIGTEFVYRILTSKKEVIESRASGSTFKEISGGELKKIPIIIPDRNLIQKFNELAESLSSLILKNEDEINYLTVTRDTLLPKLMSGEIRVPVE
ncbi:restriction endonuclease subunit S [Bacillus toyonensis]|uniref:restriction endonuclease subunit S n=1 Tax=Bacillus toyonensis TaxID=155322 RepID=UPI000B44450A|nr:restriction endonuclease subunit S [Bacillus toyonensis]MED3201380.1 restriction endonuclease subunit S [Bacillus toyonensis]OTX13964.1 restriction endonuclease subunit S [Bacillus thuringiensis serovar seoulensis]